jgi:hypothetical protein
MSITDSQQFLQRLARQGPGQQETSIVTSPGACATAWAVKIKSNVSYNVYNVKAVMVGAPGTLPVEIGQETQAVNLAEPFLEQGTLSAGTFAVMSRVGDSNIFYAKP